LIKASSGDLVIFGLSAENIKRLQAGNPMKFSFPGIPDKEFFIFAGDTEESMKASICGKCDVVYEKADE